MTGTDRIARLAAVLALVLATLPAAADAPAPWFGLADLRQPAAARVYPLDGRAAATPARLQYLPLAPPADARIACCLRPARRATPAADTAPAVERLPADDSRPLDSRALARPPRSTGGPMIALALAGPAPKVEALSAHRLRLSWPGRVTPWRVDHCTSGEGLHLRVQPEDGSAPVRALYLPLGMDVEADCPAHMLVPPSAREK